MDLRGLTGRVFRARLKRELPRWREEGVIGAAEAEALAARYQLDEEGISVATAAIYTLGVLLIGGGVISFVSWNWADLAAPVKLALITAALVAAHGTGYWWWRVSGRLPRLGHALTLLGSLIFGAGIGLVSQIYHISTDPSAGFGLWAIGAAVAAWALPSAPNGILAVGVGCVWATLFLDEHDALHWLLPYLVALPSFALAWRTSSRPLFCAAAAGTLWCMAFAAGYETEEIVGPMAALVLGAAALLAFALHPTRFSAAARAIGLVVFTGLAYFAAFHEIAEDISFAGLAPGRWLGFAVPSAICALALLAGAIRNHRDLLTRTPTTAIAFGGCVLLLCSWLPRDAEIPGAVAANIALAAICASAITSSVRTLERGPFWWGVILGGVVILSRFLEFQTELWLKAIVFLASGIAVIVFGRTFERRRFAALEHRID